MEDFKLSFENMQSRVFYVWYILMLSINLIGAIMALFIQGKSILTFASFTLEFIMIILLIQVIITKEKTSIASTLLFLVVIIEFPLLYLVYREIIVAYFILGLVAIIFFFSRRFVKVVLPIAILVNALSITLVDILDLPNKLEKGVPQKSFNLFTYFATGTAIILITQALIQYYESQRKELQELNSKLEFNASHDALTGLLNRRAILEILAHDMDYEEPFYCAIIDIDDFKFINDTYGHLTGDSILMALAQAINESDKCTYSGRYGGEEFLIILNARTKEEAKVSLEKMNARFKEIALKEYEIQTSFSGGIDYSKEFRTTASLLSTIDKKLYVAKEIGKDQIV